MNNQISNFKYGDDKYNQSIKGNDIENKNFLIESYDFNFIEIKRSYNYYNYIKQQKGNC